MQTSLEEPEQRPAVEADDLATRPASRLCRAVLRFPAEVLERSYHRAERVEVKRAHRMATRAHALTAEAS